MNDEQLIELVRRESVLYDVNDPKYLNVDTKARVWQEIGKAMNTDGHKCKARWNNIRDNFRKSLRKRRTKSTEAAKKMRPYRFENELHFLLEYMDDRKTNGNLRSGPDTEDGELDDDYDDEVDDNEEEETLQPIHFLHSLETSSNQSSGQMNPITYNNRPSSSAIATSKPTNASVPKKNTQPESVTSTLMKFLLEKKEEETKSSTQGIPSVTLDNPIDCFLFGISSTLKLLPPYLLHSAKSEIFSTVQKFEFQMLQADSPKIPSAPQQHYTPAGPFHQQQFINDDTYSSSEDSKTPLVLETNEIEM